MTNRPMGGLLVPIRWHYTAFEYDTVTKKYMSFRKQSDEGGNIKWNE